MASFHFKIKSGKKGSSLEHANYITRNAKHANGDKAHDVVMEQHGNLPEWANGNPFIFWSGADKHERKNGAAYRELELALPKEFDLNKHKDLLEEFLCQFLPGKTFHYVIHSTTASIGQCPQPHAHVMYSDRLLDEHERTPELHFKRFNANDPSRGGCKKDSGGRTPVQLKQELIESRQLWADIQNDHLKQAGVAEQVSHLSFRDRGIQKDPEGHLGPVVVKRMSQVDREKLAESRRI